VEEIAPRAEAVVEARSFPTSLFTPFVIISARGCSAIVRASAREIRGGKLLFPFPAVRLCVIRTANGDDRV
jgi:hypothetical protein